MSYPGGKNGAGAYQRIINHMPPHDTYIEPFLGSGAVMRHKQPALHNFGIDRSKRALDLYRAEAGNLRTKPRFFCGDALTYLPTMCGGSDDPSLLINRKESLIYADPPYLPQTRKGGALYEYEMSLQDHNRLLKIIVEARCMVMISGYRSDLYDEALDGWSRVDYRANTRQGMVDESLWMNFAPPLILHDYRHLGEGFRARERIKRKKARFKRKFEERDRQERAAIMEELLKLPR